MNSTDSQPKQVVRRHARRWRPQFGLRTLLVGSLLIGVVVAKVANDARRQREVVDRLESTGCQLWYQHQMGRSFVAPRGPKWLRDVLGSEYFDSIEIVDMRLSGASDDDVLKLLSVAQLSSLDVSSNRVTDTALVEMVSQRRLKELDLSRTDVTDAGLMYVGQMAALRHLRLNGNDIGDDGLAAIAKLKNLESLYLDSTRVTTAGLESLRGHSRLKELSLRGTSLTGPGLIVLAELPALRVVMLDSTSLNVHDVAHLSKLNQVETLSFASYGLTDECIRQLAAIRPRTHLKLQLSAQRLTVSGIRCLSNIPKLRSASLSGCNLNDSELEELREELPFCNLYR